VVGENDCNGLISKSKLILRFVAKATGRKIAEEFRNQCVAIRLVNHF